MEKSIHTLLFTSAVSSKEHRLLGFSAGFEDVAKAEEAKVDIEKKLKEQQDPKVETEARVLATEIALHHPSIAAYILEKMDVRKQQTSKLAALKDKASPEKNADLKAVIEGLKEGKSDSVTQGQEMIENALALIYEIADSADRPYNWSSQVEAHMDLIKAIEAADPDLGGLLPGENDNAKAELDQVRLETTSSEYPFEKAIAHMKTGSTAGKARAREDMKAAGQSLKDRINEEIKAVTSAPTGDSRALVSQALDQIKEIDQTMKDELNEGPAATPAAAPSENLELSDEDKMIIGELETGIIENENSIRDKALNDLAKHDPEYSKEQLEQKAGLINAELAKNPKIDKKVKAEGGRLVLTDKVSGVAIEEKEKKELNSFIEIIKEFLKWLTNFERDNKISNGDLNAMRSKSYALGQEIDQFKAKNPNYLTDPTLNKEYLQLTEQKNKLDADIKAREEFEAKNKIACADINAKVNQAPAGTYGFAANTTPQGQLYLVGVQPQIAHIAKQCGCQPVAVASMDGVPQYATIINKGNVNINGDNFGNINTGSRNKNMQTQGNNDVGNSRVGRGGYGYGWPDNVDARYRIASYRGVHGGYHV